MEPTKIIVSDSGTGKGVQGVDIWATHADITGTAGVTDENGECSVDPYASEGAEGFKEPFTVYVACQGYAAKVVAEWQPDAQNPLSVELTELSDGGSCIIQEVGYIPGLAVNPASGERTEDEGRLAPILGDDGRTYLYIDNVEVDGGKTQPADFNLGESVSLADNFGNTVDVKFLGIIGDVSILEWTRVDTAAEV